MNGKELKIKGNEELLKQIWINLIDNAVKFSVPNGVIDVNVELEKGFAVISVTNSGKEIEEHERNRVFEKFYRAKTATEEGSGVGLAIVKKIIELHNGEINVISANGKTSFKVILPKATEI